MLFIALILAACLYVALYLLWQASQPHLNNSTSFLRLINDMIVSPQEDIFVILRGLILIVFFYVAADFLYSTVRRSKMKLDRKAKDAAEAEAAKGNSKGRKPLPR